LRFTAHHLEVFHHIAEQGDDAAQAEQTAFVRDFANERLRLLANLEQGFAELDLDDPVHSFPAAPTGFV